MMRRQVMRFGLVGGLATLVHLSIGVVFIHFGLAPLLANGFAFLTAFGVSFIGHFGYSFSDQGSNLSIAFRRFGLIALGGFVLNAATLAALLVQTSVPPAVGLVFTTAGTAILTFFFCRFWAFRTPKTQSPAAFGGQL